ncbi:MAG: dienelactone hydrolase family protein [Alphaproteobacteria bacterium]
MRFLILGLTVAFLPLSVMAGSSITYSAGGEEFEGYSAKASGSSKGMVVIIHDWDGLTDYEKKRADMLASMGYDAFALDLFGKGRLPKSIKENKAMTGRLYKDRERMRSLLMAGLGEAQKSTGAKTVVMGYCFGGAAALEMARSGRAQDISGYVTFHGGLTTPKGQSYPKGSPPMLIAHGGADTAVTMEHVAGLSKELEAAGITYEIEVYSGAPHAFTVFDSNRYRKAADEKSWAAFREFLKTNL